MGSETRIRMIALCSLLCLTLAGSAAAQAVSSPALSDFQSRIRQAIASVRPAVVKVTAFSISLNGQPAGRTPCRSIGSGIIVDPRGYVLTNAHVVAHAQDIRVSMWRAQLLDLPGRIVDIRPEMDLALVELTGLGTYPSGTFGSPGATQVGDWVIALGNPYGLEQSVTMGIVSDQSRTLLIGELSYPELLQTDAAINQGNSGGPLIDLNGQVVGISTAIYAPQGAFAGVGFAIPASRALAYLQAVLPPKRRL